MAWIIVWYCMAQKQISDAGVGYVLDLFLIGIVIAVIVAYGIVRKRVFGEIDRAWTRNMLCIVFLYALMSFGLPFFLQKLQDLNAAVNISVESDTQDM